MSASRDYVPSSDGAFNSWQDAYFTYASDNSGALNLTIDDITALNNAKGLWETTYAAQTSAANAAREATADKIEAKSDYITLIRSITRQIQADPSITNGQREGLGITVPDSDPTRIDPPKVAPNPVVDLSQRLSHTLRIFNVDGGRTKPAGAAGVEVWYKVGGEPPVDASELTFAGLSTKFTFLQEYGGEQGNQTAYYWVRWVNAKGQPGPWCEPLSATIAA